MTAEEWATIRYFKPGELCCPHCRTEQMDLAFMRRLDDAREQFGQPIYLTSGWRCVTHNQSVGGSPTSSHLRGLAVDMRDHRDPAYRGRLHKACWIAGFRQFEFSRDGHLHIMHDPGKPSPFVGIEP